MKLNMKLRWQNKATLTAIVLGVIALAYQMLGLCGIVPAVSQSDVVTTAGMAINVLVLIGVVVDPTTGGVGDSEQAMKYDKPKE